MKINLEDVLWADICVQAGFEQLALLLRRIVEVRLSGAVPTAEIGALEALAMVQSSNLSVQKELRTLR